MEHDEVENIVRIFAPNLEPLFIKLKKNEFKKLQKHFSKVKIAEAKYVYANNQIQLKSAKFKIKKFPRNINYNAENELTFKGKKVNKPLQIMKPKFKF